jgi:hypothetical protein
MIASKYPIMVAHFHKFSRQGSKLMLKLFDYGCVIAKLDLGKDKVTDCQHDIWAQSYKTFDGRKLRLFKIS